ncbi:MAG TPA: DUF3943 domain-containing protein [Thermoanaerobaculia bacterium]|nr:DUF3943 domain-containing protein [Thermoanaerobaculia bacterium]
MLAAAPASLRLPLDTDTYRSPRGSQRKHFWLAVGEVAGVNVVTWAGDRLVLNASFARISVDSWKQNLKTGLRYDDDDFPTNQAEHPFHGSFYFNAARTNGLSFWESALFPAAGSLMWEYFGETQAPSTNDLINTSVGGVTHGEIVYRLSTMLFDNTASGSGRLWRELGGFVLNPMAGLNRLLHGETTKDFPNPDDRLPGSFSVEIDAGFQHLADGGAAPVPFPNQSLVEILVRHGDPFLGENRQPFDYFEFLVEFGQPSGDAIATRWQERGQLHSWQLSASRRSEHRLGVFLNYDYINNQTQVFSAQSLSVNILSRFPLVRGAELRAELAAIGYPLAAVQTDYPADGVAVTTIGRPYDYGQGGGARVLAHLYRGSLELLLFSYEVLWLDTSNGISLHSAIQSFHAEGRLPLSSKLAVGAGYTWNKRITSYSQRSTVEVEGPQWRVFGSVLLK